MLIRDSVVQMRGPGRTVCAYSSVQYEREHLLSLLKHWVVLHRSDLYCTRVGYFAGHHDNSNDRFSDFRSHLEPVKKREEKNHNVRELTTAFSC